MAKAGARNASELPPDGTSLPMAIAAIALRIAGSASAHGGRLNAEGCHHDRKHGGYHCHRGGAALSRSELIPGNGFAPVRCGEPGYGPHLECKSKTEFGLWSVLMQFIAKQILVSGANGKRA